MKKARKYYVYRWADNWQRPIVIRWAVIWNKKRTTIDSLPCTVLSNPGLLVIEAKTSTEALRRGKNIYHGKNTQGRA